MNELPDAAADEAAIRDLLANQITSWNAGNTDEYARTYAPDGDCVNFLGTHYRGRDAIAVSAEVPRPGSLFKKLTRGAQLEFQINQIRFVTNDVALIHATGGLTRPGRPPSRRNRRTNTSVAIRTADGWLLAASQNTSQRPIMEKILAQLTG